MAALTISGDVLGCHSNLRLNAADGCVVPQFEPVCYPSLERSMPKGKRIED